MIRYHRLEPRFVQHLPDQLMPGILYVSMEYGTVGHSCCCGCGEEVVTPLTPTDWRIIYDGETMSLSPSVGSWSLPCRSHYFIDRSRVIEAGQWTDEQVAAERRRDHLAKQHHYGADCGQMLPTLEPEVKQPDTPGRLTRLWRWFSG